VEEFKMFKITVDNAKKSFLVEVKGSFDKQEGEDFLKEYNSKLSSITPNKYNLVIIGENFKTCPQEVTPVLEKSIKFYEKSGFKEMYGTLPQSPTAAMQLKRIIKNINPNIKLINSLSEI
jgi:BRCT domain type II-containing protein